jgi:hypothetical protein
MRAVDDQKSQHRGRWTEEEAREALAAWEASGESLTAFGRRVGSNAIDQILRSRTPGA